MRRLPIEQTPVKNRVFKSKCDAYCHNRQVPRIHVRIYVCDAMYVRVKLCNSTTPQIIGKRSFPGMYRWRPSVCASIQLWVRSRPCQNHGGKAKATSEGATADPAIEKWSKHSIQPPHALTTPVIRDRRIRPLERRCP